MPLPMLQTTDAEGNTDPVETLPVSNSEGYGSFAYAGLERSLGISLETQAIGKLGGGKFVSYDDAKKRLDDEGYDYHVLHGNGLFEGELNSIVNQQSAIKRNEAIGQQSGASPYWEMAGGAADPLFLAAGPVLRGLSFAARGIGLSKFMSSAAAVSAKGGVIGAAGGGATIGAGYDFAQSKAGTAEGDADIDTHRMAVDAAIGGVTFGLLHGLTVRPPKAPDIGGYLDMIRIAEGSAAAAKRLGVDINEVTSKTGAVGLYQIEPYTAKAYDKTLSGLSDAEIAERLKEPGYNRSMAEKIVSDLHKRFGDDPEAIAVAYNAGPNVAKRFVSSGHDRSMLPEETRKYLGRIYQAAGGGATFGKRVPWDAGLLMSDLTQLSRDEVVFQDRVPKQAIDETLASVREGLPPLEERGPTAPVWWNVDGKMAARGPVMDIESKWFSDEYLRRYGGESEAVPEQPPERPMPHIAADYADNLPKLRPRGESMAIGAPELGVSNEMAHGGLVNVYRPAMPPEIIASLKRRFGIGTKYGPKPMNVGWRFMLPDELRYTPESVQDAYRAAVSAAETDSHVHIDADVSHETSDPDRFTENDDESRFHKAVVYHATNKDFVDYDFSHAGQGGGGKDAKEATYFIDKAHLSGGYANFAARMDPRNVAREEMFGQNVRPVITRLENPKEVDFGGQMYSQTRFFNEIRAAKRAGHDAVIFRNVNDSVSGHAEPGDVYAIFDANRSTRPFFGQKVNLKPGKADPGSLFTRDVRQPDPNAPKPPEDAASVQREADQLAAEAQAMHEMGGGEAGSLPPEFDAIEETLRDEGYSEDMVKAVQAAIRCGLTKGM